MRKILLVVLAVTFASSLCFAQQVSAAPASQAAQTSVATPTITITGIISMLIIGDSSKGIKSALAIDSSYGRRISLAASDETSITDKDGKVIVISNLKKGDKVNIVYEVGNLGNRADSIKLVK